MQVRRSPTACWTSAAVTVESTPPESAQTTRLSPTRARRRTTSCSTKLSIVQSVRAFATRSTKFRSISRPSAVCVTSGWNCTP